MSLLKDIVRGAEQLGFDMRPKPNNSKADKSRWEPAFPDDDEQLFGEDGYAYYLAYGMNLNQHGMSIRCPAAEPVGGSGVVGTKLVFRGVADIARTTTMGTICPVGIWRITRECLESLDMLESYPHGYRREYVPFRKLTNFNHLPGNAIVYVMNHGRISPPPQSYVRTIAQGYEDFGLDFKWLDKAVQEAGGVR